MYYNKGKNIERKERKMKYNEYSYETIKKLIAEGQEFKKKGWTEEEIVWNNDYCLSESRFVMIGYNNPDFILGEIKEFYRIGEPAIDSYGCYLSSFNRPEDRREDGVSIVTSSWLSSWSGLFFGTDDETIARRGVYKIKGFLLPSRGGG